MITCALRDDAIHDTSQCAVSCSLASR